MYGVSEIIASPTPATTQPESISLREADTWNAVFNGGRESLAGVKVNHKTTMGYPAFWRGVNLIANGVAGLPIDTFRRESDGDRVIMSHHPAQKLIKRMASPVLRARKFRKTLQAHALIFGNGFAYIERAGEGNVGQPVAMWIHDPQRMTVRYMDGELWYCTTINGEQVKYPGRDMIHITGLTHDGICGYSALDTFNEALGLGMAAQQFGSRFFGQGANMGGLLMVPGHFTEEKIRNTMTAWSEMSEGMKKAHKVALLQDGVKFQPTQVDPDSGQFNETRDFEVRAVVANILGVPPHLLGDATRTSHNSLETEEQSFLTHSLSPWLHEWEGELDLKLLSEREIERGSHFIEFNREAAVQMEFEKKVNGIAKQIEIGVLNVNESRKLINLPSIGDDGEKRYHPANWTEVGAEPEPAAVPVVEADEPSAVLRSVITCGVMDAIQIEQQKITSIGKRAKSFKSFCNQAENFYETWKTKTCSGLTSDSAAKAKEDHADESMGLLVSVATSCTQDTLSGNVTELVATWDDRAVTLTTNLMETI